MKTFKLHLIRHGMTAGNLQGLYIGSGTDIPLCDEGRAQLKSGQAEYADGLSQWENGAAELADKRAQAEAAAAEQQA